MKILTTIILVITLFLLAGCKDDAGGLSRDEVQAMIDPLQSRIADLESDLILANSRIENKTVGDRIAFQSQVVADSSLPHRFLSWVFPTAFAVEPPVEAVGTLIQMNGSPSSATQMAIKFDSGYIALYDRSRIGGSFVSTVSFPDFQILYESTDCTGIPFAPLGEFGSQALSQGIVIRDPRIDDPTDASTYWFSQPSSPIELVKYQSISRFSPPITWECVTIPVEADSIEAIRFSRNDPLVTGVPNDKYDGVPIMRSN